MNRPNTHIIQRSRLQLRLPSQEDAYSIQNRILDLFNTKVLPKLEAEFDRHAGPGLVLQFDQLHLPLGRIRLNELDAQFEYKVVAQLELALRQALSEQARPEGGLALSFRTEAVVIRHIVQFVERGSVDWSGDPESFSLERAFQQVLEAQEGGALLRSLVPLMGESSARLRVAQQVSPEVFTQILAVKGSQWALAYTQLLKVVDAYPALEAIVGKEKRQWRVWVSTYLLSMLAWTGGETGVATATPMGSSKVLQAKVKAALEGNFLDIRMLRWAWVAYVISIPGVGAAARTSQGDLVAWMNLAKNVETLSAPFNHDLIQLTKELVQSHSAIPVNVQRSGVEMFREMILVGKVSRGAAKNYVAAVKADSPQLLNRLEVFRRGIFPLGDGQSVEGKDAEGTEKNSQIQLKDGSKEKALADRFDEKDGQDSFETAQDEGSEVSGKPLKEGASQVSSPPSSQASPVSKAKHKKYYSPAVEEYYISNAGLVLLNPFLGHCFAQLGWIEGEDFIDEDRREDAVLFLAYVGTGWLAHEESSLSLAKLLCGMTLETPVRLEVDLPENVLSESNGLVEAAIHYWPKLGQVSVEAFRETFLTRSGVLKASASGWQLKVERITLDILMEFMPWGIGVLRMPWMKTMLTVDW